MTLLDIPLPLAIALAIPCDECGADPGEVCRPACTGAAVADERAHLVDHLHAQHGWGEAWLNQQPTPMLLDLHDLDHTDPDPFDPDHHHDTIGDNHA